MSSFALAAGRGRRRTVPLPRLLLGAALFVAAWRLRPALRAAPAVVLASGDVGAAGRAGGGDVGDDAAGAKPGGDPCVAIREKAMADAKPRLSQWERSVQDGVIIQGFGEKSSKILERTLAGFDREVAALKLGDEAPCAADRIALETDIKRPITALFLAQQSAIEQVLYHKLRKDLLRLMKRRGRELKSREKLRLLHAALSDYDVQVKDLQPPFIEDSERQRAEKRLSELQWGIGDTEEGKAMKERWQQESMRSGAMRQQRSQIHLSLSPGVRLMIRPSGIGNFHTYSKRQVGPPHNPNEVSIGVLNDGSIGDVYNRKPRPPFLKFQPTVNLEMSFG